MNCRQLSVALVFAWACATLAVASPVYFPSRVQPPAPPREFRGAWVATVANINWPSKPGLPVEQQKAELLTILDRAAALNLNAIIFQARPACDAFYASKIEPWSYYLTGAMGRAPEPFYDPLEFAVTEAHRRGLELHAWVNPYRAALIRTNLVISPNHISNTRPDMVRTYGQYLWLDPGSREVQDYCLGVVMDIVRRYDVDGIHCDDYFYPYRELDADRKEIDFPDEASWNRYGAGRKISRDDWRRENIDTYIHRVYEAIKSVKPWVKFGVSPFGIWQPGYPPQIKGFNAFTTLYCDSRKWLQSGWLDYCAPQLYWAIQPSEQSFPALFSWWQAQNVRQRNLWPGVDSGKTMARWRSSEILNQINITRRSGYLSPGVIHWNMKSLMPANGPLGSALQTGPYAERALVPASRWLEPEFFSPRRAYAPRALDELAPPATRELPAHPGVKVFPGSIMTWDIDGMDKVSVWLVQIKDAHQWRTSILPKGVRHLELRDAPEIISVTAIDRCGVASPSTVLQRGENLVR